MSLNLIGEFLDGIMLFEPNIYKDNRGAFIELFRASDFENYGLEYNFVQENLSISRQGVIRGLHYQLEPPQGKFIQVISGKTKFIELDIRPNSKTFGKHVEFYLNDKNNYLLWVPPGFANGFSTFTERAIVNYKVTSYWNPRSEGIILYNDNSLNINWEVDSPILSDRDKRGLLFKDVTFK
jgi:dTDP-4-dehydrorhamnose 3,5-epimerase